MDQPSRVGKYELLDYLGGGMSRVYRARDTLIGRIVCVKILTEQADTDAKARFLQEARVAGNLNHDNVIRVYDFGEDEQGNPYMVMEFLEGDDLRHLMTQRRTGDLDWKLKTALQIARALGHIHDCKIIHRDIKPENIHITGPGVVKLMDFGIAKAENVSLTKTGFTLGTPYYMAPEQVRGEAPTMLVDIYAYGVMMFELLTGIRPTDGETIETIFYKVLYQPLDLSPLLSANIPLVIRDLVQRCTAKEPQQRPQSFVEVCQVLESVLGDAAPKLEHAAPPQTMAAVASAGVMPTVATPQAQPVAAPEPFVAAPPPQKKRSLVPLAAALLGGVVILGVVLAYLLTRAPEAPPEAAVPAGMVLVPGDKPFYIDQTEVTNAAYASFCQARRLPLPEAFPHDRPNLPVVNITFVDAQEYARWAGKRLPALAEWQRAARGTDSGLPATQANALVAAGSRPDAINGLRIADMVGNAWEFVDDRRTPSPGAIRSFAFLTPPASGDEPWYAMCGGSFTVPVSEALLNDSAAVPARFRAPDLGFRCAKDR
jgi:serine/threonine-protein kinase